MWFLYALVDNKKKTRIFLQPGKLYTIGRGDVADIIPPIYEKSISRRHATLKTEPIPVENLRQLDWQPSVWFDDLGSTFGSFVNSDKLEKEQSVLLKNNDIIRVGKKNGLFQLSWEPLIICFQTLLPEDMQKLRTTALKIGAKITQSVQSPYTHLLMSSLRTSTKVAHCLANGNPIVSPRWLDALVDTLVDRHDNDFAYPPISDYLPPLDDSCEFPLGIPEFAPNPRRAQLFTGKRFVFFEEKQHQSLSPLVDACNGDATLLTLNKTDPFDEQLDGENTIVIACDQLQDTKAGKTIIHALDSFQRRTIDSMEILWAILYCSTDIQCNTNLNIPALKPTCSPNTASTNNTSNINTDGALNRDMSTSSVPGNVSTTTNQPSSSRPSSSKQSQRLATTPAPSIHNLKSNQTKTETISQRSEKEDLDLDLEDIFDQLVGNYEPSRSPPTLKQQPSEPSNSQATTALNHTTGSHAGHQEHSKTQPTDRPRHTADLDHDVLEITTTTGRRAPDSPDSLQQEEPFSCSSSGTSTKRKRTAEQETSRSVLDKGKDRMHEPVIHNITNQLEPSTEGDIEDSSSGQKRRSRKKNSATISNDTSPLIDRTPFTLPELENENVDVMVGKKYTKVKYIKLMAAPDPPMNRATRQQSLPQTSHQINYKAFKKVKRW
ncbi:hypothetical protein BC941DRAFT_411971 [Chlamydoabsidia padenii]|nr:hypothetical protein BC941DRAFT_411971 [Chlamydoabsidia padenii]